MLSKVMASGSGLALMVFVLLATGCANLKGINKFAATSSKTVAEPFPYSYGDYSFDSCYVYDTSSGTGKYPCDCRVGSLYDTAVTREAGKLSNYFLALAKLSGSTDIINVDTLVGAVTAGKYGSLTISPTEAGVASGVATAIQDLLTANFKTKHIAANLHQYGGAVDSSLAAYIVHLTALDGQAHNLSIYLAPRLSAYRAGAPPGPERWSILYAYNEKIKDLMERHARFENLIRQVQLIKDGYDQLVLHAGDIKSKTLTHRLLALVNNISYLSNSKKH